MRSLPPKEKLRAFASPSAEASSVVEWVSYLDADEFLISRCEPDLSLRSLLREIETRPYPVPDAVLFNWKWFGSENAFAKTDGYFWERFQYSVHNRHVKTLETNSILSMRSLHVPVLFPGSSASDSLLQPLQERQ